MSIPIVRTMQRRRTVSGPPKTQASRKGGASSSPHTGLIAFSKSADDDDMGKRSSWGPNIIVTMLSGARLTWHRYLHGIESAVRDEIIGFLESLTSGQRSHFKTAYGRLSAKEKRRLLAALKFVSQSPTLV